MSPIDNMTFGSVINIKTDGEKFFLPFRYVESSQLIMFICHDYLWITANICAAVTPSKGINHLSVRQNSVATVAIVAYAVNNFVYASAAACDN